MEPMELINQRKNIFMAVLCALCIIMMIASAAFSHGAQVLRRPASFVLMPVVSAFSNAGSFIAGRAHSVLNIATLEADASRLREENERLLRQVGLLESYLDYMEEWQWLMGMRETMFPRFTLLEATIITRGQGVWYGRPYIDVGSRDGVLVNMPVVTCSVFGRVVEVGRNFSVVRTIVDDTSAFYVYARNTGCEGMARGCPTLMLHGLLRLEFTSQSAEIAVGDNIYTSHLSSIYPAGLRVGVVTEIRQADGGDRYAVVRPFADVFRARVVNVIMGLFEFEKE